MASRAIAWAAVTVWISANAFAADVEWPLAGTDGAATVYYRVAQPDRGEKRLWVRSDQAPLNSYVALLEVQCDPHRYRTIQRQTFYAPRAVGTPATTAGSDTFYVYAVPGTPLDAAISASCGTAAFETGSSEGLDGAPASPALRAAVGASAPLSTPPAPPRSPIPPNPSCSESGSCYGDISSATGLPKTVDVPGYYRRDGTYVRGYYRSK